MNFKDFSRTVKDIGVLFSMIKQKNIRDKMRYSNLSNNMMISDLAVNNNYNSITVVKLDFAVVKQVDGRATHMTHITRHLGAGRAPTLTRSCWIYP
jgi:hypothetical protein